METDEVDAMKRFEDPGMFLIGFKPMEKLKIHHHIQPSRFLYPEEDEVKGRSADLQTYKMFMRKCFIHRTGYKYLKILY